MSDSLDKIKQVVSFSVRQGIYVIVIALLIGLGGLWGIIEFSIGGMRDRLNNIEMQQIATNKAILDLTGEFRELKGYIEAKLDPLDAKKLMERSSIQTGPKYAGDTDSARFISFSNVQWDDVNKHYPEIVDLNTNKIKGWPAKKIFDSAKFKNCLSIVSKYRVLSDECKQFDGLKISRTESGISFIYDPKS